MRRWLRGSIARRGVTGRRHGRIAAFSRHSGRNPGPQRLDFFSRHTLARGRRHERTLGGHLREGHLREPLSVHVGVGRREIFLRPEAREIELPVVALEAPLREHERDLARYPSLFERRERRRDAGVSRAARRGIPRGSRVVVARAGIGRARERDDASADETDRNQEHPAQKDERFQRPDRATRTRRQQGLRRSMHAIVTKAQSA